jgi:uncharacterized glyoxalase superfamily protein PhnB
MTARPALARNRSIPSCTVIPVLGYNDVGTAVAWLCQAFGFVERLRIGTHRVQLLFGDGAIVISERRRAAGHAGADTAAPELGYSIMLRVADAQAHCDHARSCGARIVAEPTDFPYGERQYTAQDHEGHVWTFTQSIDDIDPRVWGGELLVPEEASP